MQRARQLIEPYTRMPGVLGVYLVGSATRPFRDAISDYDFEVVVEDEAFEAVPPDQRHTFVVDEGPPRRVDHEFFLRSRSDFEALEGSNRDVDHYPFQHAKVLFDPTGVVAQTVVRLAQLPEDVRVLRCRVHYFEFMANARRMLKRTDGQDELNARLVLNEAVRALVSLLFVSKGSWPSTKHWARQELEALGAPAEIVVRAGTALASASAADVQALLDLVDTWLDREGMDFHRDRMKLLYWAFQSDEGKAAFMRWGSR